MGAFTTDALPVLSGLARGYAVCDHWFSFGLMTAHSLTWKIYGYSEEPLTRKNFPDTTGAPDANFGTFADFTADAAAGRLPQYSFLEPSWGSSGNSQHPNYDVALACGCPPCWSRR